MATCKFADMVVGGIYYMINNDTKKADTNVKYTLESGDLWVVADDGRLTRSVLSTMSVINAEFMSVGEQALGELNKGINIKSNGGTSELILENSNVNYSMWAKENPPLLLTLEDIVDKKMITIGLSFEQFNDMISYVEQLKLIYKNIENSIDNK